MPIQPDFVKEELLQELSESFRMHSQIPSELYSRYRIKRGLRAVWATYTATYSTKANANRSKAA